MTATLIDGENIFPANRRVEKRLLSCSGYFHWRRMTENSVEYTYSGGECLKLGIIHVFLGRDETPPV